MPYKMTYYPEFMAKRCNFPVGNKELEVASWEDIQATNQDLPDMTGWSCVGGVDYAKTNDFVACVLIFRKGETYYVLHHTFVCSKSRDLPGIKAPLQEWAVRGDLEFVDDVEIQPELVAGWFEKMGRFYNIVKIAIDNFRYSLLNKAFKTIGFDAFELKNIRLVRPSDIIRVAPVINSLFVRHGWVWGDVPILRWYTNNTKKIEKDGNTTYGKIEANYRKTDGFMAIVSAMAVVDDIPDDFDIPMDLGVYVY